MSNCEALPYKAYMPSLEDRYHCYRPLVLSPKKSGVSLLSSGLMPWFAADSGVFWVIVKQRPLGDGGRLK
jgi:hypothetical protein